MSASFNIGRRGDYFRISRGGLEGGETGKLYHYLRSYPAGVSQLELEDGYGFGIVWVGGGGATLRITSERISGTARLGQLDAEGEVD
jgi:hypothetical protein